MDCTFHAEVVSEQTSEHLQGLGVPTATNAKRPEIIESRVIFVYSLGIPERTRYASCKGYENTVVVQGVKIVVTSLSARIERFIPTPPRAKHFIFNDQ